MSVKEYLDKIKLYLNDLIDNHKIQNERNVQLTIVVKFISSKDSEEIRIMHIKSNNIRILTRDEADKITNELFHSFLQRY